MSLDPIISPSLEHLELLVSGKQYGNNINHLHKRSLGLRKQLALSTAIVSKRLHRTYKLNVTSIPNVTMSNNPKKIVSWIQLLKYINSDLPHLKRMQLSKLSPTNILRSRINSCATIAQLCRHSRDNYDELPRITVTCFVTIQDYHGSKPYDITGKSMVKLVIQGVFLRSVQRVGLNYGFFDLLGVLVWARKISR